MKIKITKNNEEFWFNAIPTTKALEYNDSKQAIKKLNHLNKIILV
jgi:prophage antirepressor-like protein